MIKLPEEICLVSQAKAVAEKWYKWVGKQLEFIPTKYTAEVPTMAVDSVGRLYINPEFVLTGNDGKPFSVESIAYVLLHEDFHLFLDHPERREALLPNASAEQCLAWNIGCDLVIQQMLDSHDQHRPAGTVCLADCQERWPALEPNCTAERYYSVIWQGMQDEKQKGRDPQDEGDGEGEGQNEGDGAGGKGDEQSQDGADGGSTGDKPGPLDPSNSGSSSDGIPRDYEDEQDLGSVGANLSRLQEVRENLPEVSQSGIGSVAGTIRQMLDNKLVRQPDPFDTLRSIVARATVAQEGSPEETYRRRGRRQEFDDLPIKGYVYHQPECSIIIDTSGSMCCHDRTKRALTAISQGCARVRRPRVVAWDYGLQSDDYLTSADKFVWSGCGGTDMAEAVLYTAKEHNPDCIVLVTDGGTGYPEKPTRMPLVVALVAHDGPPPPSWAKTVDLTKGGKVNVG